jgi:hypothetical protein
MRLLKHVGPIPYSQPGFDEGGQRYISPDATTNVASFLTLPFSTAELVHNGWKYSPGGGWHFAIDYFFPDLSKTFDISELIIHVR